VCLESCYIYNRVADFAAGFTPMMIKETRKTDRSEDDRESLRRRQPISDSTLPGNSHLVVSFCYLDSIKI
jgi:hypothetical protein